MLMIRSLSAIAGCYLKLQVLHSINAQRLVTLRCTMSTACSTSTLASVKPIIGVVQMTSTPDKEANFAQVAALVTRAKAKGAQVVFLPECADYIGESKEQTALLAEPADGDLVTRYRQLAKQNDVWLSVGSYHEKPAATESSTKLYNTHLMIDSSGVVRGQYRKLHLFDIDVPGGIPIRESAYVHAGKQLGPPVSTPAGNVGLAICYDMRFAELALSLAQQGADILTYPSAFTVPTGLAHWQTLLRCRAIETQCYVVAAAQIGKHHAKRSSYGHAMVIDPWGCVVAECSDMVDVCVAEVDLQYLRRVRTDMPVWQHRRHDVYGAVNTTCRDDIDSSPDYQFGQHRIPSSCVIYKTALSMAFVNRKPVLPGHTLVSPLRAAPRLSDLTPAETTDLFLAVQRVCDVIQRYHSASSLTVSVQDGPDAGQSVQHVHVHILPRRPGDFAKNDDIYEALSAHDKNVAPSAWRSDTNMAEEAALLRPHFL